MKRITNLILLLAVLLWGCQSKKAEQQTNVVYTSTTPLVSDVSLPQSYVANIQSKRNIEVRSQQEGILQQVFVSEEQMRRLRKLVQHKSKLRLICKTQVN